jgi:hypothetical protein
MRTIQHPSPLPPNPVGVRRGSPLPPDPPVVVIGESPQPTDNDDEHGAQA